MSEQYDYIGSEKLWKKSIILLFNNAVPTAGVIQC